MKSSIHGGRTALGLAFALGRKKEGPDMFQTMDDESYVSGGELLGKPVPVDDDQADVDETATPKRGGLKQRITSSFRKGVKAESPKSVASQLHREKSLGGKDGRPSMLAPPSMTSVLAGVEAEEEAATMAAAASEERRTAALRSNPRRGMKKSAFKKKNTSIGTTSTEDESDAHDLEASKDLNCSSASLSLSDLTLPSRPTLAPAPSPLGRPSMTSVQSSPQKFLAGPSMQNLAAASSADLDAPSMVDLKAPSLTDLKPPSMANLNIDVPEEDDGEKSVERLTSEPKQKRSVRGRRSIKVGNLSESEDEPDTKPSKEELSEKESKMENYFSKLRRGRRSKSSDRSVCSRAQSVQVGSQTVRGVRSTVSISLEETKGIHMDLMVSPRATPATPSSRRRLFGDRGRPATPRTPSSATPTVDVTVSTLMETPGRPHRNANNNGVETPTFFHSHRDARTALAPITPLKTPKTPKKEGSLSSIPTTPKTSPSDTSRRGGRMLTPTSSGSSKTRDKSVERVLSMLDHISPTKEKASPGTTRQHFSYHLPEAAQCRRPVPAAEPVTTSSVDDVSEDGFPIDMVKSPLGIRPVRKGKSRVELLKKEMNEKVLANRAHYLQKTSNSIAGHLERASPRKTDRRRTGDSSVMGSASVMEADGMRRSTRERRTASSDGSVASHDIRSTPRKSSRSKVAARGLDNIDEGKAAAPDPTSPRCRRSQSDEKLPGLDSSRSERASRSRSESAVDYDAARVSPTMSTRRITSRRPSRTSSGSRGARDQLEKTSLRNSERSVRGPEVRRSEARPSPKRHSKNDRIVEDIHLPGFDFSVSGGGKKSPRSIRCSDSISAFAAQLLIPESEFDSSRLNIQFENVTSVYSKEP